MSFENKYRMNEEQNVFLAKRNIVDYIWKSAKLEGLGVTFPQTQEIYDGGIIHGVPRDEVVAVNNLKHAWQFLFDSLDYPMDLPYLCHLNQVVGSNLIYGSGYLRKIPVRMGGTSWVPDMPIESMIKEELADVLAIESATERAITLMLWSMRRQMFPDGNKRTSMLAANQVMIQNGCGIISVPIEEQGAFTEKLVRFYETNDMTDIKSFVYDRCTDGTDFEAEIELPSPERFLSKNAAKKPKQHER